MSYDILWRFDVPPAKRAAFEAAYGPNGDWAKLFAKAEGFLEVRLLRDGDGVYLTIDRWTSQRAFEAFKREFATEYDILDRDLEGLAALETRIGAFEPVA